MLQAWSLILLQKRLPSPPGLFRQCMNNMQRHKTAEEDGTMFQVILTLADWCRASSKTSCYRRIGHALHNP